MITVAQYLRTIKLLLPRHWIATGIGDEEMLDVLNYGRHRCSLALAGTIPMWTSGIVRGDGLNTLDRTINSSAVRRWDGTGFSTVGWLEVQVPGWFLAVQAVNVYARERWYPARILPIRGAWDIGAHTWVTAFSYSPVCTTYSDSESESWHWLCVSAGSVPPVRDTVECWYIKTPLYLEPGDGDQDMPMWVYGMLVYSTVLTLYERYARRLPDTVAVIHAAMQQTVQYINEWIVAVLPRLIRDTAVRQSIMQSYLIGEVL